MFRWRFSLQKTVSFSENERNLHMPCCTYNCHIFFSTLSYNCIMATNLSASNQIWCVRVRQWHTMYFIKFGEKIHLYNTLYVFYRAVSTLGCIFLITPEIRPTSSYNLPDQTNFLEIGGVYHPPPPIPPGVSALCIIAVIVYTSVF
jgi:hypothetical protein